MTAAVYTLKCSRCSRSRTYTGTLEAARKMLCGPCSVHGHYIARMTVVGHTDAPPVEPSEPVTKPPVDETPYWRITEKQEGEARRLFETAFGEKE